MQPDYSPYLINQKVQFQLNQDKTYLFSKIVRFLLLQSVISQDVTRENFCFIPDLGKYEGEYTDDKLRKRWGITQEEWELIDSKMSNVEPSDE